LLRALFDQSLARVDKRRGEPTNLRQGEGGFPPSGLMGSNSGRAARRATLKPSLSAAWIGLAVTSMLCLALFLGAVFFHPTSDHDTIERTLLVGASVLALGAFGTLLILSLRVRESEHRTAVAERHLKTAIDSISEGFVIYDKDEAFVMCNDQYRALYPQIADQLVPGARFVDLLQAMTKTDAIVNVSEDAQTWRENRVRDFRNPQGTSEMQMSDGRWILLRDRKLPDGGSVGIRTDITEIKKREQAIIESERHHRDLIERAPVAIYVHRDNVILYANSKTADMLGYDGADQIIGKDIFELIHPDHHRLAQVRMSKITANDEPLPQVDMKFRRADGSVIYTEAQVTPVMFDDQPALESILRNITARRRTERALMESELRYRTLFELAPDAMLVHDGQKILFANAAAAKIFGAQDERNLFHLPLDEILPKDSSPEDHARLATWEDGGQIASCRLRKLDQQTFDAEVVTAPSNYHSEAVCHTVIRDVTERKLVDATMAQNAKLASLGGMAAGLAHELSQPLNIMRFAADGGLLKMNRGKADDALHLKNYKLIQDQAERMGSIMDSMRIFSRKDPGPIVEFDLSLCVRDIVHLLRNPFRVDNISINVTGAVSGLMAMGSPIQLEQVLLNLLKNARDSIVDDHQGTVTGWDGLITIDCHARPERHDAVIRISDNGGGIGDDDIKHIFDPFFTTKEMIYGFVKQSEGNIRIYSEPGVGTTLDIFLPVTQQKAEQRITEALDSEKEKVRFDGIKVLAVDDEYDLLEVASTYLEDMGFEVIAVTNGEQAMKSIESNPDIELLVTDIVMPGGMNGTELSKKVKMKLPNIKILYMSGFPSGVIADKSGTALDAPLLTKPYSLNELGSALEDLLHESA